MPQKIGNDWVLSPTDIQMLNNLYNKFSSSPGNFGTAVRRSYAIVNKVPDKPLLFISMNPSFSPGKGMPAGTPAIYGIPPLGAPANLTNPFFIAINKFYNDLLNYSVKNVPRLAHHDLVFIRETNQNNVKNWMKNYPKFFDPQLALSKDIIELSEPRLIVVLNAGARDEFKKLFNKQHVRFDRNLGAHIYNMRGKEIPVLFSSMLSGQRALDLGSRESLLWHVDYII